MPDLGHAQTDRLLESLEERLGDIYTQAYKDVKKKADDYFARFAVKDKAKRDLVAAGKMSKDEYSTWRRNQMLSGKRWTDLRDQLAQDLTNVNKIAAGMVRGELNEVFAINANYSEYLIENGMCMNYGFTLYDRNTVANLVMNDPDIIPWKPNVDVPADLRWNRQMVTSHITQGILQGESIPHLSKRLLKTVNNDKVAAVRTARTAVTSAQNAGRQAVYDKAKSMGLNLQKEWLATLDGRTRHDHGMADGQRVPLDGKFTVGGYKMKYPGDMSAPGWLVYNCRCTTITVEPDHITKGEEPRKTYSEWVKDKKAQVQKTVQELQSDQSYEIFMTAFDGTESPVEFWMNMNAEQIDAFKASGKKINELFEDIKKTQPQNTTRKIVDEWKQASPGGKERFALSHDYSSQKMQFQKVKAKSDGWMADANINGIISVREDGIDSWEFVVGHEAGHQLTNLFPELQKVVIENPGNLLGRFNTRVMKFDGVFGEYNPDEAWATCVSNYVRNPERFEEMYPDTYLAVDEFFKSSPSALDFVKKALEDYRRIFDI